MDIDISPYLNRLSEVYDEIDHEYEKAARHYGNFSCEGCEDNCCRTVFYHYTLIENFFLVEGFGRLPDDEKKEIIRRAHDYVKSLSEKPFGETGLSIMCPLNVDGPCALYKNRPLICRIHGLPAVLESPRKGTQRWEGCRRFKETGRNISHEIDRTKFYSLIAFIEGDLRKNMVFFQKYKKTIAEMIVDQTKDDVTLVKKMGPEDFHKDSHII